MIPDLAVRIGSLALPNPVMLASGTCGYGLEMSPHGDLASLGAVVVKGLSLAPSPGNPPPRIVETPSGMLNSIGLENVGLAAFLADKLPGLRRAGARVIVNFYGGCRADYRELAARLDGAAGVHALEMNISCPNVKRGGLLLGQEPGEVHKAVAAVRRVTRLPLLVKLTPNVTDVRLTARAAAEAGADALTLINTLQGMAIDVETRRPALARVVGGLSGPAIRPVAVRMVWQVRQALSIPLVGCGGVWTARDALEFLLAGATAVQLGTVNFTHPGRWVEVVAGISDYLRRHGISRATDLVGAVSV
ncbi:MAG TPA: dihydroorotate dehydrogenase [Candidatus Methanoperedens sp.]|nr:dihydroorotate dehydrogenase [Candidatus Methanoperedens sp.]